MTMFEAASETVAPLWYHFTMPVVGMIGVLLGGRMKGTGASRAPDSAPEQEGRPLRPAE